jgi:hypothetical protein
MPNPRHLEPGKTEGVKVVVAQGLLDRAVGTFTGPDFCLIFAP